MTAICFCSKNHGDFGEFALFADSPKLSTARPESGAGVIALRAESLILWRALN
jgi:hypothetical protein